MHYQRTDVLTVSSGVAKGGGGWVGRSGAPPQSPLGLRETLSRRNNKWTYASLVTYEWRSQDWGGWMGLLPKPRCAPRPPPELGRAEQQRSLGRRFNSLRT